MAETTATENQKKLLAAFKAAESDGLVKTADVAKMLTDLGDALNPAEASQIMSELSSSEEAPGKVNAEAALDMILTNYHLGS
ncbi:hypothetical protein OG215_37720 (plasmid) [Streptomyces globisporus]|uniref:hypothetical protein n=1 Tax=Streptomyces globisporus TaxID=1908 RepID=UPI002F90B0C4|nr:hypothetical protein OG215_37720 [Streptomyces globisporus]